MSIVPNKELETVGAILFFGAIAAFFIWFVFAMAFTASPKYTHYSEESVTGKFFDEGGWFLRTNDTSALRISGEEYQRVPNGSIVIVMRQNNPALFGYDDPPQYIGRL